MIRHLTLLSSSFLSAAALAQPNLNSANNAPLAGTEFIYHHTAYASDLVSGADVNWDYSTLANGTNDTMTYVLPPVTPNGALFTTSTVAMDDHTLRYFYYKVTTNALEQVGEDSIDIQVPYTDGAILLPFPCTFLTNWTDPVAASYTASSIPFVRSGTISGIADSYGDLTMPYGTIPNVLRVQSTLTVTDVSGFGSIANTVTRYSFYKTWLHVPIMTLLTKSLSINGGAPVVTQYTQWLDNAGVGVGILEQAHSANPFGLTVSPNPATDAITLDFGTEGNTAVTVQVIDAQGKVVLNDALGTMGIGFQHRVLDATNWTAGLYTVRISDNTGAASTRRVVKQ